MILYFSAELGDNLDHPFVLDKTTVRNVIPNRFIGIYYLGNLSNKCFTIKYVGRSDIRLKTRLIQQCMKKQYTHFTYISTSTIKEAYFLECREWHRLPNLDNKIHPDSPKNLPYICPYCLVKDEFKF